MLEERACGTRWQKAASATRPVASRAARTPLKGNGTRAVVQLHERGSLKAEPGPRKQPFACVPHTDGFIGLLRCPRILLLAPTQPRSCELSPGHSLEPSASPCRGPPPQPSLDQAGPPEDIRGRQGLRTSVPRSTLRDQIAARSVSVRDDQQNIPSRRKVQKRIKGVKKCEDSEEKP